MTKIFEEVALYIAGPYPVFDRPPNHGQERKVSELPTSNDAAFYILAKQHNGHTVASTSM